MLSRIRPLGIKLRFENRLYKLGESIELEIELRPRIELKVIEGRVELVCEERYIEVYIKNGKYTLAARIRKWYSKPCSRLWRWLPVAGQQYVERKMWDGTAIVRFTARPVSRFWRFIPLFGAYALFNHGKNIKTTVESKCIRLFDDYEHKDISPAKINIATALSLEANPVHKGDIVWILPFVFEGDKFEHPLTATHLGRSGDASIRIEDGEVWDDLYTFDVIKLGIPMLLGLTTIVGALLGIGGTLIVVLFGGGSN